MVLFNNCAVDSEVQEMVSNCVKDYSAVLGPLITMIEYVFSFVHKHFFAKKRILIRFIALGNVYFSPPSECPQGPFFQKKCR
jgi:hypothetical protein